MSLFEVITITLSVILGLSMSHILWSTIATVRVRHKLKLHWLPLFWAACIFLQHAYYWFAVYSIEQSIGGWSWSWYLQLLLLAVLLFAAGALILPPELQSADDLSQDFQEHGRLALIPFAAHQLLWVPTNFRMGDQVFPDDLLVPSNFVNFVLFALILVGFLGKRNLIQATAASLYLALLIWAQTTVWAPGVF
jgi:hypothetical protein